MHPIVAGYSKPEWATHMRTSANYVLVGRETTGVGVAPIYFFFVFFSGWVVSALVCGGGCVAVVTRGGSSFGRGGKFIREELPGECWVGLELVVTIVLVFCHRGSGREAVVREGRAGQVVVFLLLLLNVVLPGVTRGRGV